MVRCIGVATPNSAPSRATRPERCGSSRRRPRRRSLCIEVVISGGKFSETAVMGPAFAMVDGDEKYDYIEFYDKLVADL